MLYPLSYERTNQQYTAVRTPMVRAAAQASEHLAHVVGWKIYD
jgi:hypothetical protein